MDALDILAYLAAFILIKINIMSQVKSGDKIKVHYHGKLTNGETFDSSAGREPLAFEVGSGMVIKGFDDGVTGMTVGEKKQSRSLSWKPMVPAILKW